MSGEHESGQTSEKENAFGTKHFRCVVQGKVSCGGKICEDEGWCDSLPNEDGVSE